MKKLLGILSLSIISTIVQAQPGPAQLMKQADFNKVLPRNIAAVRQQFIVPYMRKTESKNRYLITNGGNYIKPVIQTAFPIKFDWRDKGAITDVKDQNPYGTCWAFSLTAAIESTYLIETGESVNLAEQDLINCGTRRNPACDPGNGKDLLSQGDIFNINLKKNGLGEEKYNSYKGDENKMIDSITPNCAKICGPCNETKEKPWGVEVIEWITTDANGKELGDYDYIPESVIKKRVMETGPLDICIWIPPGSKIFGLTKDNDMLDEKFTLTSGTPTTQESFKGIASHLPASFSTATKGFGGHLMLLIGWDDAKGAWLLKNSWGKGWGNDGYCYIKYRSNFICNRRLAPCWVKPKLPDYFVTAVWRKENQEEQQVYEWSYEDFKQKYDEMSATGWQISIVKATVKDNKLRYSAVWRNSKEKTTAVFGLNGDDFNKKYNELWSQGWRLKMINNFEYNGNMLYSGIWQKSAAEEIKAYGWTYEEFRKKYDELWPQGWRLKLLDNFVFYGKVMFSAVWEKSTADEFQVYGWDYQQFRKKYDEVWNQGWRVKILNNYMLNGKLYYTAVFTKSTAAEVQVYTWPYSDFRKKDAEMHKGGWSIASLNVY